MSAEWRRAPRLKGLPFATSTWEILDLPEAPQHPVEEALDSLRGAVRVVYPEGRVEQPQLRTVHAGMVY